MNTLQSTRGLCGAVTACILLPIHLKLYILQGLFPRFTRPTSQAVCELQKFD
jgi:hypothetical protein